MGTKCAPNYATLVLGYLEIKLFEDLKKTHSNELSKRIKINYRRFLDDIFVIWSEELGSINLLNNALNKLDQNLVFTLDGSGKRVNFLDISIYCYQNRVETDIYYKPTDTKKYLPFNSNHPRHTKYAIP